MAAAYRANIMEENQAELAAQNETVEFSAKPYEIILRLVPTHQLTP